MRIATVAPLFAVGLVALIAACATSADVTGDEGALDSGQSPSGPVDSGASTMGTDSGTPPIGQVDSGSAAKDGGSSSDSGSTLDSGMSTGTDSGGGGGVDSGGGTTGDECPTTGASGAVYFIEYGNLPDPTAVPCPCAANQCCYPGLIGPACVKK